jgi:putative endonuclease
MKLPQFAVYVLNSLKDHKFYIGYTSNFTRRMEEHAEGRSKSTKCRRPFVCVFCEYYLSKSDALRREQYFKITAGKRVLRLMLQESLMLVANVAAVAIF